MPAHTNPKQLPQYYIEQSHPPIIEPDIFDLVQDELQKLKENPYAKTNNHIFSGKIFCSKCGRPYGSKTVHAGSKYKSIVWMCRERIYSGARCPSPHVRHEAVEVAFVTVLNKLIRNRDAMISRQREMIQRLCDSSALDRELADARNETDVLLEVLNRYINDNAQEATDQEEYQRRYSEMEARYESARQRISVIEQKIAGQRAMMLKANQFLDLIEARDDLVTEFDAEAFTALIERVVVENAIHLNFVFKDSMEMRKRKAGCHIAAVR